MNTKKIEQYSKILAIIQITLSSLGIFGSLFFFIAIPFLQKIFAEYSLFFNYLIISMIIGVIFSIISIIGGIGILLLREWGRILLIIFAVLTIISSVIQTIIFWDLVTAQSIAQSLLSSIVSLAFNGIIIWFFTQKDVRRHFKKHF